MQSTTHNAALKCLPAPATAAVIAACTAILGLFAWCEWSSRDAALLTILRASGVLGLLLLIATISFHLLRQLVTGHRMAAALASSQANLRLLSAISTDMVTRIGLDDRIKYASPSASRVMGWQPSELAGRSVFAYTNPADLPAMQEAIERLKRGEIEEARVVHRVGHRKGDEIWMDSTLRLTRKGDGSADGIVSISRDVTEHKQLETFAIEDGLTGLANRRCFDERLRQEWERAQRERNSIGLLMIDVDHFKAYNDERGHPAGDLCLQTIGRILAAEVQRPADVAARYGGEEFAILLPNTDAAGCVRVGERIHRAIHGASIFHASNVPSGIVTVSIGAVACRPAIERLSDPAVMVEAADRALYTAKQTGRDRLVMSGETVTYLSAAS
jgi:diguanylate cyclase (GGDEF)-like protein/PAS domain S-box-containing protein